MKKIEKFLGSFIYRYEPVVITAVIIAFILLLAVQAIVALFHTDWSTLVVTLLLLVFVASVFDSIYSSIKK